MSTFNGFVPEFPQIRIDYFRTLPGRPPPLACFLSHIHSDHLLGLDSLKSPFVYCSPATREVLLRLEKHPHRMNFVKGIAEVTKQTYKHLKKLLKPLPLDVPTSIELAPGNSVQVTLLDANHCLGACMFLIESPTDAILYTGDIRSEPWWVNSLARHPKLVPYVCSKSDSAVRRLSNIYLDTTFAIKNKPYRTFPAKADGLSELLRAVAQYPPTTQFYMHVWTFGYEDVWLALSQALGSQIHLDRYRYDAYTSIKRSQGGGLDAKEAPALCGFMVGNVQHLGILTQDPAVRLHSCEKGSGCAILEGPRAPRVVHIKPIVSRHNDIEIIEMGLGGGKGDLDQIHELDLGGEVALAQMKALCEQKISDLATRARVMRVLDERAGNGETRLTLDYTGNLHLDNLQLQNDMPFEQVIEIVTRLAEQDGPPTEITDRLRQSRTGPGLPKLITFPYSRHSSYDELRHLVSIFRPKDIFPCTAPTVAHFNEERSMEALFGDVCHVNSDDSAQTFAWDAVMRQAVAHESTGEKRKFGQLDEAGDGAHTQDREDDADDEDSSNLKYHSADEMHARSSSQQGVPTSSKEGMTYIDCVGSRLEIRQRAFAAATDGMWAERIRLQCTTKMRRSQEL